MKDKDIIKSDLERRNKMIEILLKTKGVINKASIISSLMGNPVRLKIIYIFWTDGGFYVSELAEILDMKISAISQHLKKLFDRGLVVQYKSGQIVYYDISPDMIDTINYFINIIDNN